MTRKTKLSILVLAATLCLVLAVLSRTDTGTGRNAPTADPTLSQETAAGTSDPQSPISPEESQRAVAPEAKQAALEGCFTLTFKHKSASGHSNRSDCSNHRNAVRTNMEAAAKNLCVRVDGIPVKFERKKDVISFGPMAGPNSVVSVQYCLGKSKCSSNCKVPKDQFMDALGVADDASDRKPASAKWSKDDHDDGDATAHVSAELLGDSDDTNAPVFTDWQLDAQDSSCRQVAAE